MRRSLALALATLAVAPACSSTYLPQARGRIAMIMQGGGPAYVRDGRVYRHGFLGRGLRRAVHGVPAAEQAADEYRGRMRDGLLMSVGGLVCSVVATAKLAADSDAGRNESGEVPTTAWVALGCLALGLGGIGYLATAEPYRYDAINIFNDTAPPWTQAAPGVSTLSPRESLRMRD